MSGYYTLDLLQGMAGITIHGLHIEQTASGVKVQVVVDTADQVRQVAERLGVGAEARTQEVERGPLAWLHTDVTVERAGLRVNVGACELVASVGRPKAQVLA